MSPTLTRDPRGVPGGGTLSHAKRRRLYSSAKQECKGQLNMSAENELINLVRAGGKFSSDNELAQKLGVTRAMVSSWRSGRYVLPDDQIAQLCALATLDGASWMARIHTERAASATERALWQSILDRLAPITAVVGVLGLVALGIHAGSHEAVVAAFSPVAITPTLYTLCEM